MWHFIRVLYFLIRCSKTQMTSLGPRTDMKMSNATSTIIHHLTQSRLGRDLKQPSCCHIKTRTCHRHIIPFYLCLAHSSDCYVFWKKWKTAHKISLTSCIVSSNISISCQPLPTQLCHTLGVARTAPFPSLLEIVNCVSVLIWPNLSSMSVVALKLQRISGSMRSVSTKTTTRNWTIKFHSWATSTRRPTRSSSGWTKNKALHIRSTISSQFANQPMVQSTTPIGPAYRSSKNLCSQATS